MKITSTTSVTTFKPITLSITLETQSEVAALKRITIANDHLCVALRLSLIEQCFEGLDIGLSSLLLEDLLKEFKNRLAAH